jgi:formamidopyrimidine-DNA glycosylase
MPELPEVETVRCGLEPVLKDRVLERVILRRENLRFPFPDGFGQLLTGKNIVSVERRAKFLIIRLEGGLVLISHLGMSGSFRIYDGEVPDLDPHDHVVFLTSDNVEIRYNDPRRFGFMQLCDETELDDNPMIAKLGPEPVNPGISGKVLAERLKGKEAPIKAALLDQSIIAGIGNIYACEALFMAGISPRRKSRTVQGGRADALAKSIEDVLLLAIKAGGASLKDHRHPSGELGYFQHAFQVYGQTGNPCPRCGEKTLIKQIAQSGRSTFFCSRCQR